MAENEWQVRVRGSEEWRRVPDGRTAAKYVRDYSEMFAEARVREVGPWRSMPSEPDVSEEVDHG